MNGTKSSQVKESLSKPDIHKKWINIYRSSKNNEYFELVFDYITNFLKAPKNSIFLDAGCGTCVDSIRLAKRGFLVKAVDFSESVLKIAEASVKYEGLEDKIKIQREDILSLSFEDKTFDYVLCWGVLMHIPDIEKAVSEFIRVLKPGGTIIIGENNMYALQLIISRNMKWLLRKEKVISKETPSGIEYWWNDPEGTVMTREANIQWLIKKFKSNRFVVKKHIAGQFTEAYVRDFPELLKSLIHSFNNFWFKYVKIPYFAVGNILILNKER